VLIAAATVAAFASGVAHAEGSAQLYPVNATCAPNSAGGSCRANIEWRTDAYGPATGAQVRRRSYMQVYAQAGEVLETGSSAVGVGAGDILIYDPGVVTDSNAEPLPAIVTGSNGFRCSDQRVSSGIAAQGRITSRAQELAGPQAADGSGNLGGYVPCFYVAPMTGIYGVAFYGPAGDGSAVDGGPTGDIDLTSAANFDATQGTSIAAWDLTVRSSISSITDLDGRLFTNALIAFTGGNGRPIDVSLDVVTLDGFRYRTDTRGIDPNGFAFYGNQAGFLDGDGKSPLYHDAYGTTSSSELTGLAGGVTFAPPQYPIFFGAPAPGTLTALGIPLTPAAPTISSLTYTGNVSGNTSSIGVGGSFSFTANVGGVYEIVISRDGVDFDPGAAGNRVLRGVVTSGTETIAWDGKDNSGADFPVGANYAVRASLHAGEYHFPLIDAENSTLGGPTFTLLNPPGGVCSGGSGCTTAFFDDRGYRTVGPNAATVGALPPPDAPLCGIGPPAAPYHSDPVTGYDSSGAMRAYGGDVGSNTNVPCTGSFGDVKGLDTWTYFPSTTSSASLAIVDSADVSISKTHAGTFTVGQNGSFTLAIANAGPVASGAVTVTDPLPAGLTFVSGSGIGWNCSAAGADVTCTSAAGLAASASSTVSLTVSVEAAAAPSVTNAASVSAVEFDPNTANNHSSDTVAVIPIPAAVADTASTAEGTAVIVDVLGNDALGVTPTSIASHTPPARGSVSCATTCTYTPDPGFSGQDSFDYAIVDANGRTSTATVTIIVTPAPADLSITVGGPGGAKPQSDVALTADVRSDGPGAARAVEVTLTMPSHLVVRPATIVIDGVPAGSACIVTGSVITCSLGSLAAGSVAHITWSATVVASTPAGTLVVHGAVRSPTTDPDPNNNMSRVAIGVARSPVVRGPPKLSVSSTADRAQVRPGGEVRITYVVSNGGESSTGAIACVPAPDNATFVSAPGAVFRRGSACWTISQLAPGSSKRFTVVLRVDVTAPPGTLRSYAVVKPRRGRVLRDPVVVRVLQGRPRARPGGVTG
jgi:uncharacterized repeat protein (TIGR01451 family)